VRFLYPSLYKSNEDAGTLEAVYPALVKLAAQAICQQTIVMSAPEIKEMTLEVFRTRLLEHEEAPSLPLRPAEVLPVVTPDTGPAPGRLN
jgi:hypothetical protein